MSLDLDRLVDPCGNWVLGADDTGGVYTWHRVKNGIENPVTSLTGTGQFHLTECDRRHCGEALEEHPEGFPECTDCVPPT